jgi:MFS transporter, PHS family, inorganic phosphate transporter
VLTILQCLQSLLPSMSLFVVWGTLLTCLRFSPTKHRPRMMATVFAMQPIGQIAGNLVSLIVVAAYKSHGDDNLTRTVDTMWRWVIGLGVIPGVIALAFRFAIPETPRFLLDIEDDPIKAEFDATPLFGELASTGSMSVGTGEHVELEDGSGPSNFPTSPGRTMSMEEFVLPAPSMSREDDAGTAQNSQAPWTISQQAPPITLNSPWKLSRKDIKQYFWVEGNWRTLFATAMTWVSLPLLSYRPH